MFLDYLLYSDKGLIGEIIVKKGAEGKIRNEKTSTNVR